MTEIELNTHGRASSFPTSMRVIIYDTRGDREDDTPMSMTHSGALASKVSTIIDNLGLTQEEVGTIVDASARSIARWSAGDVVPQRLNKQRLLELAYVADAVTEIMPRENANLWILSPNRLLNHESPAERIHAGRYKDVLDLIEALAEGVVV